MTEYTYEDFQKRIEKWSYGEQVDFLMQGNWWCDEIISFIKEVWSKQDDDFGPDEVDVYEFLQIKSTSRINLKKKYDDLERRYVELLVQCEDLQRQVINATHLLNDCGYYLEDGRWVDGEN